MSAPQDTIAAFLDFMAAHGIRPIDPIGAKLAAGGIVPFRADGDKLGRANGWALLHLDTNPVGVFGHHRLGIEGLPWHGERSPHVTPGARRALASRWRATKAAREREEAEKHAEAAKRSVALWEAASADCAGHPYLQRKQMDWAGLRRNGKGLIAPMRDLAGAIWNLQEIDADGVKRFRAGGRVRGLCWRLGHLPGDGETIAIGEGVATMTAARAATGLPVAAAMSAGNLEPVALALRTARPGSTIILCADMDPNGVGLKAAIAAARAVGGLVARPPRPPGWPDSKGWDFADTWLAPRGKAMIRAALTLENGGAA